MLVLILVLKIVLDLGIIFGIYLIHKLKQPLRRVLYLMTAKIISFGIQKGGSSKTTTSVVVSYLLSRDYKVLAIDMDSQGNLTEFLGRRDVASFSGQTILEAMQAEDVTDFIFEITENLHLVPADDLLATFSRWLYNDHRGDKAKVLYESLKPVLDIYDYIILDTPPALGDLTINALSASDRVVAMFEASVFCYSALGRFLETCWHVREKVNPRLAVAGILRGLIDARRTDNKALISQVADTYGELCFETILTRNAAAGRLPLVGFENNNELDRAVAQYEGFVKELLERV